MVYYGSITHIQNTWLASEEDPDISWTRMKEIPSVEKKTPLVELLFEGGVFLAVKTGRLAWKWHGKSDLKFTSK